MNEARGKMSVVYFWQNVNESPDATLGHVGNLIASRLQFKRQSIPPKLLKKKTGRELVEISNQIHFSEH